MSKASPARRTRRAPPSISISTFPDTTTPWWWCWHVAVPATGRTCSDQLHPGWWTVRATYTSPTTTICTWTSGNVTSSSGSSNDLATMPIDASIRGRRFLPESSTGCKQAEVWHAPRGGKRAHMTTSRHTLQLTQIPPVKVGLRIRRLPRDVFRAFVDPAVTTRFWFTKSSGKLVPGARVQWEWGMYDVSTEVSVREIEENSRILIEWGDGDESPPEGTDL
jgi:hypothetical protein